MIFEKLMLAGGAAANLFACEIRDHGLDAHPMDGMAHLVDEFRSSLSPGWFYNATLLPKMSARVVNGQLTFKVHDLSPGLQQMQQMINFKLRWVGLAASIHFSFHC
ncbi:hypothetical protein ACTXT7_002183 [Hymenolepis weldensis]